MTANTRTSMIMMLTNKKAQKDLGLNHPGQDGVGAASKDDRAGERNDQEDAEQHKAPAPNPRHQLPQTGDDGRVEGAKQAGRVTVSRANGVDGGSHEYLVSGTDSRDEPVPLRTTGVATATRISVADITPFAGEMVKEASAPPAALCSGGTAPRPGVRQAASRSQEPPSLWQTSERRRPEGLRAPQLSPARRTAVAVAGGRRQAEAPVQGVQNQEGRNAHYPSGGRSIAAPVSARFGAGGRPRSRGTAFPRFVWECAGRRRGDHLVHRQPPVDQHHRGGAPRRHPRGCIETDPGLGLGSSRRYRLGQRVCRRVWKRPLLGAGKGCRQWQSRLLAGEHRDGFGDDVRGRRRGHGRRNGEDSPLRASGGRPAPGLQLARLPPRISELAG